YPSSPSCVHSPHHGRALHAYRLTGINANKEPAATDSPPALAIGAGTGLFCGRFARHADFEHVAVLENRDAALLFAHDDDFRLNAHPYEILIRDLPGAADRYAFHDEILVIGRRGIDDLFVKIGEQFKIVGVYGNTFHGFSSFTGNLQWLSIIVA